MWAINYFRLLPTDEKYKSMPFDWLEMLFLNYMSSVDYEEIRKNYYQSIKGRMSAQQRKEYIEEIDQLDNDLVNLLGYSKEESIAIKNELRETW